MYLWMWKQRLFFFKQKTAYEMRISDWSSDVCSSDLGFFASGLDHRHHPALGQAVAHLDLEFLDHAGEWRRHFHRRLVRLQRDQPLVLFDRVTDPIGRESCRERVCQYV